jgi:hypothetical protein
MSTTQPSTADDSTEPELSDERLEDLADEILDVCDDHFDLDRHVVSLHVAQLDEPWCDDSREVRFMLDTDGGHTKANIINAVLDADLPLELDSTCGGHEQLSFHATA